jgi:4-amino-4-deoxy-L-arabinose transferase-like glycosyltransferase
MGHFERIIRKKQAYIGFSLFLVALVPRVVGLRVFLTPDEPNWMYRSIAFSIAILNGDLGATIHEGTPGGIPTQWLGAISILSCYVIHRLDLVPFPASTVAGGGTSLLGYLEWLQGEPQNLLDILVAVRLSVALVTSLGVLGIYILARKLFHTKTAILSALLLTMDPFYLAHSRVFHTDAVTSVFMILSVLSFMFCFRERCMCSPFKFTFSWRYAVLSGIFAGLALSGKSIALVTILFMGLSAILIYLFGIWQLSKINPKTLSRLVIVLGLGMLISAATFFLLWPAMWVDPVGTVQHLLAATVELVEEGHDQFFLGKVTTDPGPWFYPLVLFFRVTPLTLIGLGVNLATLVRSTRRRGHLVLLWIYIVLFVLFITLSPKKNDRYLLPIFPALNILSVGGIYELAAIVRKAFWCQATEWVARTQKVFIVAGCLILQAAFALPHHPYYFTYYNALAGGTHLASRVLLVGWGEGLDQAARYLNAKKGAESLKAASWYGERTFTHFFAGQLYHLTRRGFFWNRINYVVLYVNQVQRQLPDPQLVNCLRSLEPEYIVHMAGLDYAWIYALPHPLPDCALPLQHAEYLQFSDSILFLGYEIVEKPGTFDGKLRMNLYWRGLREMEEDYTIYLKLINDAYHIWGQQDSRPYWDGLPTNSWKKGQVIGDPREIAVLPGTPQGLYRIEVILYDLHSGRTLDPLGGEKALLGPVEVPRLESLIPESLDISHPLGVNLDDKVRLLGYNVESGFRPGDNIHLTLFWQCLEEMEQSYTVFTHLVDGGDNIASQKDNPPVDGFYPTTKWEVGEIVRDQYDLVTPPEAPPGQYRLEVGMYLVETGERLDVSEHSDSSASSRIVLQSVNVKGQ